MRGIFRIPAPLRGIKSRATISQLLVPIHNQGQFLDLSACSCFFSCLAALGSLGIRFTCWLIDAGWPIARRSVIHWLLTEARRFTNAGHTAFLGSQPILALLRCPPFARHAVAPFFGTASGKK